MAQTIIKDYIRDDGKYKIDFKECEAVIKHKTLTLLE